MVGVDPFVNIIFKKALLNCSIRKLHPSLPMLDALPPVPLIDRPIDPVHLSIPVPLIVFIRPSVPVATLPFKAPLSILLIISVVPLIAVGIGLLALFPLSLPVFAAVFEEAHIGAAVKPHVLALAFWLALDVGSCVAVLVCEDIGALPVLEAVEPFSLIFVSVLPLVYPIALGLRLAPLPDIAVPEESPPNPVALFKSSSPLSVIYLPVDPGIDPFSIGFPSHEVSFVPVSI
jgi:hypothetical protein